MAGTSGTAKITLTGFIETHSYSFHPVITRISPTLVMMTTGAEFATSCPWNERLIAQSDPNIAMRSPPIKDKILRYLLPIGYSFFPSCSARAQYLDNLSAATCKMNWSTFKIHHFRLCHIFISGCTNDLRYTPEKDGLKNSSENIWILKDENIGERAEFRGGKSFGSVHMNRKSESGIHKLFLHSRSDSESDKTIRRVMYWKNWRRY